MPTSQPTCCQLRTARRSSKMMNLFFSFFRFPLLMIKHVQESATGIPRQRNSERHASQCSLNILQRNCSELSPNCLMIRTKCDRGWREREDGKEGRSRRESASGPVGSHVFQSGIPAKKRLLNCRALRSRDYVFNTMNLCVNELEWYE